MFSSIVSHVYFLQNNGVFHISNRSFIEFSEFSESDELVRHESELV